MKKINISKIAYFVLNIFMLAFLYYLLKVDMFPFQYIIAIGLFLFLWSLIIFYLQVKKWKKNGKKKKVVGYCLSAFLAIIMGVIVFYLSSTMSFLDTLGGNNVTNYNFYLITLADSEITTGEIKEVGYVNNELTKVDESIKRLEEFITFEKIIYNNYDEAINSLISKELQSLVIEETYYNNLEDYDGVFKILETISHQVVIDTGKEVPVTSEPFVFYINGSDNYGKIYDVSLSDVNMMVVVNPVTKQVLLVSIPRDYYVNLAGTSGIDKLTHAGLYGVQTSISTIENLLQTDINYYAKVNFSTLINLVDALGGITAYSEHTFTSSEASGGVFNFYEGYNDMNGVQALAFSRERKAFLAGDRVRGINQQAVIDALVKEVVSPSILNSYTSILKSIEGTFQTNITDEEITSLIKMQLNDMADWNISTYSLEGTDLYTYDSYTYPNNNLYFMNPIVESIEYAIELIEKIKSGEILEESYTYEGASRTPMHVAVTRPEVEEPEEPENPETPVDPEEPENPEIPVDPEEPTDPETPVDPEEPTDPEIPVDPEEPTDPETPGDPEQPTEPETTVDPPEESDNPGTT